MKPWTCPACGHVAADLAAVTKHAGKCGKKPATKGAPKLAPVAMATSWTLPILMEGGPNGRKIPSQNLFKTHDWQVYAATAKAWKAHLHPALYNAKLVGANFFWSSWVLTRLYSGREREFDYGNLVGSKVIPDALKFHGVIVDDAPKHFHMDYRQRPGVGSWQLELTEIRNAPPNPLP